jgi:hypothetical protein
MSVFCEGAKYGKVDKSYQQDFSNWPHQIFSESVLGQLSMGFSEKQSNIRKIFDWPVNHFRDV